MSVIHVYIHSVHAGFITCILADAYDFYSADMLMCMIFPPEVSNWPGGWGGTLGSS
jgi:hypothetical protein